MPRRQRPKRRHGEGVDLAGGGGGEDDDSGGEGGQGSGSTLPPPPPPPPAASPVPAQKRLCRRLFDLPVICSEITRGCSCSCGQHPGEGTTSCPCVQELRSRLEAAVSRFLEEVAQLLTSPCYLRPGPSARIEQDAPPTFKLDFVNAMSSDRIYTNTEVLATDGNPLKIRMILSNPQCSNRSRLLSANVGIVVLEGDFDADDRSGCTSEEFENNIVRPRPRVGALLAGKLVLKLKDGDACLEGISFRDNSKFTRSGKFRLGVKLAEDLGERVQEGVTGPFTVLEARGIGYKKCDIPILEDEVWRLKGISKGGPFHNALVEYRITSVEHFLKRYYEDETGLRKILGLSNAQNALWTKMVNHAKKYNPGDALYSYSMEDKKITLYFTYPGRIVGATIGDNEYKAFDDLDTASKAQVEKLRKEAYKNVNYEQHDYVMRNNQPIPINCNTLQRSIRPGSESTEPIDQTFPEANEQEISEDNRVTGDDQPQLRRHGSKRVRALPPTQENEADASLDTGGQMDPSPEIQYGTLNADFIAASVTLQITSAANENLGPAVLDQGSNQMPFTYGGPSVYCPEQRVASESESSYTLSTLDGLPIFFSEHSLSEIDDDRFWKEVEQELINNIPQFSAANLKELPADVRRVMVKLLSCRRWIKLTAPVKWMGIMASSKKKRDSKGKAHA